MYLISNSDAEYEAQHKNIILAYEAALEVSNYKTPTLCVIVTCLEEVLVDEVTDELEEFFGLDEDDVGIDIFNVHEQMLEEAGLSLPTVTMEECADFLIAADLAFMHLGTIYNSPIVPITRNF